jgi:F0F1-type ATP synthase assembly protein I
MNKKNLENKENNRISIIKAFAFATSSIFMIISFLVIGYFIGNIWGDTGAGIGILIGGLLGIISLFKDIGYFFKNDKEGK